jgi:hypothetical protein
MRKDLHNRSTPTLVFDLHRSLDPFAEDRWRTCRSDLQRIVIWLPWHPVDDLAARSTAASTHLLALPQAPWPAAARRRARLTAAGLLAASRRLKGTPGPLKLQSHGNSLQFRNI